METSGAGRAYALATIAKHLPLRQQAQDVCQGHLQPDEPDAPGTPKALRLAPTHIQDLPVSPERFGMGTEGADMEACLETLPGERRPVGHSDHFWVVQTLSGVAEG